MTPKEKAIKQIKMIQNGEWDRNNPEPPKGAIAVGLWYDNNFSYGMEYGAIVVLMQMFEITKEDL